MSELNIYMVEFIIQALEDSFWHTRICQSRISKPVSFWDEQKESSMSLLPDLWYDQLHSTTGIYIHFLHHKTHLFNVVLLHDSPCYTRLHKSRSKGAVWRHTNFQRCKDVKVASKIFIYIGVSFHEISRSLTYKDDHFWEMHDDGVSIAYRYRVFNM